MKTCLLRRLVVATVFLAGAPVTVAAQPPDSVWLAARGFFVRGENGYALAHLDASEVRRLRGSRLTQVIAATLPRLEVRPDAARRTTIFLHPDADWQSGQEGCELSMFLNGRLVQQVGARTGGIDRTVRRSDVDAIEVYEGDVAPVGHPEGCGAVLIWAYRMRNSVDDEFSGQLRGRVVQQPGAEPVAGVRVVIEPGGQEQTTDSSGRFDFGAMPAAVYTLTAFTPQGPSWSTTIGLRAFAIAQIDIEVEIGS